MNPGRMATMKTKETPPIKMSPGSASSDIHIADPSVFVVGKKRRAYLWVGNDAAGNKACFATLSGEKTLRKLANQILEALG
jgi:hypothetical protein